MPDDMGLRPSLQVSRISASVNGSSDLHIIHNNHGSVMIHDHN